MKLDMKTLMDGKQAADHALDDVQKIADMLLCARIGFCRAGDKCSDGGLEQNGYFDNRDIITQMRAEAFTAMAALERLRALGGKVKVNATRAGST